MKSTRSIRWLCVLLTAVFFSQNLYAQDAGKTDESSLSKKELRQLHREQRKEEREAKREERHHRHDADESEAASNNDASMTSSPAANQVQQNSEEIEDAVEKALKEHESVEESSEQSTKDDIVNYDSDDYSDNSESIETEEPNSEPMDWTWLYAAIAVVLFLLVVRSRYKKRCKACKSWNTMKETDRVVTDRLKSTIKKTLKTKNSKGIEIRSREVAVPATVTHTDVHRKCAKCGHTDILKETKKTEN